MYIWDKNVPLHEIQKEELCEDNIITWIFEGFTPTAKLINGKAYSIISDHIGTPILAIDTQGNKVWGRELDIYGRVRKEFTSDDVKDRRSGFIPFLYAGQYYDRETDLAYNRFRYYSPDIGTYISQDPIGLKGRNPNIYAYVWDTNTWVDIFGLAATCQEEIKELPQFEGMTRDEIHRIVEERGFIKIKDRNGDQTFVKRTDDGMYVVVRTDTGKNTDRGFADDIDHSHKETSNSYNDRGFTDVQSTISYNDLGEVSIDKREIHIPMN